MPLTFMSRDAHSLIDALQLPSAYQHGVQPPHLLETHISWVLLTGDYAYKVKKPVRLPFLDFSTLELRRHYCEEELRLNRRLAPDLYLDVVPITGTVEAPTVGGVETPIEYAVQMRQFAQEDLLSARIADGTLTAKHIDRLADEAAAFHQSLPSAAGDCRYGTADVVFREALDNLDALESSATGVRVREDLAELRDWTHREFSWRHADFDNRKRHGFVRECHGDMHLGNMVLLDEKVVIFDGIEFSEELRWIDVMNETAFTAMDLEDRGRPDFAHRFLNRYLEQTGDYAGLSVFTFYLVYRALVRAKVAAIRSEQQPEHSGARRKLQTELAGYVRLARKCTRPHDRRLLITHGVSGSGKTTGTTPLVEELGAVRVRSDVERKRLFQIPPEQHAAAPPQQGLYSPDATRRTYARVAECTEQVLHGGFTAIADATFLKAAERRRFRRMADDWQVPFGILDFTADEAELRARLRWRSGDATEVSDANEQVLEHQLQSREPLSKEEAGFVCRLSQERSELHAAEIQASAHPNGLHKEKPCRAGRGV
jgi:aminoglycoside phosphotransferase family enzyme/predicted kinase